MKIQLREFDVLKSTNETAVAMAQEGAPEGTVIVAARQEGGHGRMQRVWSSPLGGLWFTVILRHSNACKQGNLSSILGIDLRSKDNGKRANKVA